MKLFTLALLSCLTFACGCSSNMIRADAVDGTMRRICQRHDAYVSADPAFSPLEKSVILRDSALIRGVLDAAKPSTQPVK